jgi:hypothetical protein
VYAEALAGLRSPARDRKPRRPLLENPYLAIVDSRKATLIPEAGMWQRLFWWQDDVAPRLDTVEDCIAWAGPESMFLPPKRWGFERQYRFIDAGKMPDSAQGWRQVEYVMPTA